MKLYQLPYSHYSAKVKIVLHEKGIPFETPPIAPGWLQSAEWRAINPLGKVPYLEHEGFGIGESEVIAEYLEEAFPLPAMLPVEPRRRAESRWLSRFHDLYLGPQLSILYFALSDGRAGQPGFSAEVDRLYELLAILEARIAPSPFFFGERFGLADASYCLSYQYVLMLAAAHGRPLAEATDIPRLSAWFAAVRGRPSVAGVLAAAEAALAGG